MILITWPEGHVRFNVSPWHAYDVFMELGSTRPAETENERKLMFVIFIFPSVRLVRQKVIFSFHRTIVHSFIILAFMVIFMPFLRVPSYNLACIIMDLNNSVKTKSFYNRYKAWEKSCGWNFLPMSWFQIWINTQFWHGTRRECWQEYIRISVETSTNRGGGILWKLNQLLRCYQCKEFRIFDKCLT